MIGHPVGISFGFGVSSTTVNEEEDSHNSDEEVWITSTFNVDQDVKDCISRAADSVGLKEILNYAVEMHDHTDWIKQSQGSFQPVEVTEGLWIVPEWNKPPDLEAVNIILNPGLAFGTGEHSTAKLCLLLLRGLIKGGEKFLDYGTCSGVLAIAALKGSSKIPMVSKKRKSILSPQQWRTLFTPDGKHHDKGVEFLKKVRSGGVVLSIRLEVWPFLLGVFLLDEFIGTSSLEQMPMEELGPQQQFTRLQFSNT